MNTNQPQPLFDRALLAERKRRHAHRLAEHDFLFQEMNVRMGERLDDINRTFKNVLVVGDHAPDLVGKLAGANVRHARFDSDGETIVAAEGAALEPTHFDLVLSNMVLHWANDLPGALVQMKLLLKPDGLMLAGLAGGGTLAELKHCLLDAEMEITGGAGLRVPPFTDVKDAGHLLQRAGFAMPVADMDPFDVRYRSPLKLLDDLRFMGEANAMIERAKTTLRRDTLMKYDELYRSRYTDDDGLCYASFNFLFLTGWAPAPDQPKPKAPGSATVSLADALKAKIK